jgi:GntR family transcriptional regulator
MPKNSTVRTLRLVTSSPFGDSPGKGLPALYYLLADVFRRRIEDGVWPVGSQIPTLDELVAEFRAARATVRQALTIVEGEGLLSRHRGRGTFVLKRPNRDPIFRIGTKRMTLVGPRTSIKRELLDVEPNAGSFTPSHGGGTLAPSYGYFRRRHCIDGTPYVIRSGYLDSRLWQRLTLQQIRTLPLMRTLVNKLGAKFDRCEQTLTITTADYELAKLLKVHLNCPLAVLDRSVFDEDNVLVHETRGYYRGDLVKMSTILK